ncbi:FAR1 DNA-binding domain [Sesbania bispinosa]|nr:FAR1 DNA-binding domain [Sesbania bispinosa]
MNVSSIPIVEDVEKWVNNIHGNIVQHGQGSVVEYSSQLEMEFESEVEAYEFYNEHSRRNEFGIRREYGNKSKKDGILTSRRFSCFREGKRGINKRDHLMKEPRAETRTGCEAQYVHLIRSHRHILESQASQIVLADESGLKPKDFHEYMPKQAGGIYTVGYTKQDHKNYLRTRRKQSLSHDLKVLDVMNIKLIPQHYILKRWIRDARFGAKKSMDGGESMAMCDVSISLANGSIDNNVNTIDFGGAKGIKKRDCSYKSKKQPKSWVEKLARKRKQLQSVQTRATAHCKESKQSQPLQDDPNSPSSTLQIVLGFANSPSTLLLKGLSCIEGITPAR